MFEYMDEIVESLKGFTESAAEYGAGERRL